MKNQRLKRAFTLIELLVVIAIIGLLAAMVLPVLARMKIKAQVAQTKLDISRLVTAIHDYEGAYNRLPVSSNALASVAVSGDDFTFGTAQLPPLKGATAPQPIRSQGDYQANNSEVIAILMDLENYGNGTPTINKGHVKNPQRTQFLDAKTVSDTKSAGVGSDGVFRDLWGNPYIITLDLNGDGKTRDAVYRNHTLSQMQPGQPTGYFGLYNSHSPPDTDFFEAHSSIMVWSAGPDGTVETTGTKANAAPNNDNVLSWR